MRILGRLLCRLGIHREHLAATFPHPIRATIYGHKCARCGATRLTISGRRVRSVDYTDTSPPDTHRQAVGWRAEVEGRPVDDTVWWR